MTLRRRNYDAPGNTDDAAPSAAAESGGIESRCSPDLKQPFEILPEHSTKMGPFQATTKAQEPSADMENASFKNSFTEITERNWQTHGRWDMLKYFFTLSFLFLVWAIGDVLVTGELSRVSTLLGNNAATLALFGCCAWIPNMKTTKRLLFLALISKFVLQTIYIISDMNEDCLDGDEPLPACHEMHERHEIPAAFLFSIVLRPIMALKIAQLGFTRSAAIIFLQTALLAFIACFVATKCTVMEARCLAFQVATVCLSTGMVLVSTRQLEPLIFKVYCKETLSEQHLAKLQSKHRAERLVYHKVKNSMVDAFSTLSLFLAGKCNRVHLQRVCTSLQNSTNFIHKTLNISKIFKGSYSASSMYVVLRDLLEQYSDPGTKIIGAVDGECKFEDSIVPHMFLDLCLDNAKAHGEGCATITCNGPRNGKLTIEIKNRIRPREEGATLQTGVVTGHKAFSTGLGVKDLQDVCHILDTPFSSGAQGEWWLCKIKLKAEMTGNVGGQTTAPISLPRDLNIAIMDDQNMIMRMMKRTLEKLGIGLRISIFHLNTISAIDDFTRESVPAVGETWDIILLDQNLACGSHGTVVLGTFILKTALKDCQACKVIYSANNSADDQAMYKRAGAHGSIGKGSPTLGLELSRIYEHFMEQ